MRLEIKPLSYQTIFFTIKVLGNQLPRCILADFEDGGIRSAIGSKAIARLLHKNGNFIQEGISASFRLNYLHIPNGSSSGSMF